jgi:hypothetical protein
LWGEPRAATSATVLILHAHNPSRLLDTVGHHCWTRPCSQAGRGKLYLGRGALCHLQVKPAKNSHGPEPRTHPKSELNGSFQLLTSDYQLMPPSLNPAELGISCSARTHVTRPGAVLPANGEKHDTYYYRRSNVLSGSQPLILKMRIANLLVWLRPA